MESINRLNVFIASPGDVKEERGIVREICKELSNSAYLKKTGISLEASGWEDFGPSPGRPQETINKLVKKCDVFICILHKKFGSPTGKEESGTLEEFFLAYKLWEELEVPHIMFYFKDVVIRSIKDSQDPQFLKILELKEKIEEKNLLFYYSYDTTEKFRKKVREHLDEWIAENATNLKKAKTRPRHFTTTLGIPETYRNWVIDHCQHMDLRNLMEKGKAIRVELPEVFIPLYTDPLEKKEKKGISGKELSEERHEPVDIEELVCGNDCLLIEGQAGSGKTTLQKHMAYSIINQKIGRGLDDYLPVLIFLKDLQNHFKELKITKADSSKAEKFLADYLSDKGLDIKIVKDYCQTGKAIFFLDGLDEVEPKLRELMVNSLADFRLKYDHSKMVLSGRPHGMDATVINRFGKKRVKIHTLNISQVETFIRKWFNFIFIHGSEIGKKTAKEMIGEIKAHQSIKELIDNPLMLTAICILYYDDRKLPEQRAELYKKFVDNLVHRRFDDPERIRNFLIALAYQVHSTGERGFNKDFALKILGELCYPKEQEETNKNYEKRLEANKPLLEKDFSEIEQNCGLLKLEKGLYNFWHLTFQEFLSARYIATKKFDYIEEIKNYWENDWYKEVIELLIGFLSLENQGWANKIVKKELEGEEKAPFRRWRLASQSLLDIHKDNRDFDVLKLAQERMKSIFTLEKNPTIKAETGEILGWLGDPRDLEEFVLIEGGKYKHKYIDWHPRKSYEHEAEISSFEIGKYPVTNQWYQEFLNAKGYEKEDYWTLEGKKWLKKEGAKNPHDDLWHDRKWKCPNAPVVGVNWYEAVAFCNWLSEISDDGYVYRLPTEEEWQAAAAGKEGREYAWGKGWDENKCNTDESKIGKTSSVGIFEEGKTREGVYDLSGNVWEWAKTKYNTKESRDDFLVGEEWEQGPVLRGGSWFVYLENARCADRSYSYPYYRFSYVGFRCVRTKKA